MPVGFFFVPAPGALSPHASGASGPRYSQALRPASNRVVFLHQRTLIWRHCPSGNLARPRRKPCPARTCDA
ncbi:hypothetical protein Hsc_4952 [Herbaspirillum seropedicae]|nr:hypothetical protein Hsc_4952 [Herbaspirillum seropedicae]